MRKLLALLTIVMALLCSVSPCRAEDGFMKLDLQIDKSGCKGSFSDAIIRVQDMIYFFDRPGAPCKTIKVGDFDESCIAPNRKYIAVESFPGLQYTSQSQLQLLDNRGTTIWKVVLPLPCTPLAVADDGQRVLVRCSSEEGEPTIKYFDGRGKELCSLPGMEIAGGGSAISQNCRFWTCREYNLGKPESKWYFYDESGRMTRSTPSNGSRVQQIGDNGNCLIAEKTAAGWRYAQLDRSGKKLRQDPVEVTQSRKGDALFYFAGPEIVFEDPSGKSRVLRDKFMSLGNGPFIFVGVVPDGSAAVFTSYSGHLPFTVLLVSKNGNVKRADLALSSFENLRYAAVEFVAGRNVMLVWDEFRTKCNVYSIGGAGR